MKTMKFTKAELEAMVTEMRIERERGMEEGDLLRQRKAEAIIVKLNILLNYGGKVEVA